MQAALRTVIDLNTAFDIWTIDRKSQGRADFCADYGK